MQAGGWNGRFRDAKEGVSIRMRVWYLCVDAGRDDDDGGGGDGCCRSC